MRPISLSVTPAQTPTIHLKRGCAKPLHNGHPWVLADSIASIEGPRPEPGTEVRVVDERGNILGRGFMSPGSAIAVRILTRIDEPISNALLAERLSGALRLRRSMGLGEGTNAYRLVNSEGDGLPGLIVDVYGPWLSLQVGTAGMHRRVDPILNWLEENLHPKGIQDRSDERTRKIERLPLPQIGPLRGGVPERIEYAIVDGFQQAFDLRAGHGQKTGLYLDQRENRVRAAQFCAGKHMLDVFCHSGGFALHAAKAGAKSITLVDSSAEALELAKANLERNGIADADLYEADWPEAFKAQRTAERRFGVIVIDPPKFARTRENVPRALGAYKDLNAQAARLLEPGGILVTCSCSGNVSEIDFERTVAAGLMSAGRRGMVLERRGAASDHPTPPGFDQGRYLKCLIIAVE